MPDDYSRDELWEKLARHLAGESSPEERDQLERWLAEEPGRAELLVQLRTALDRAGFNPAAPITSPVDLDVEAALARVHERLDQPDVRPITAAPSRRRRSRLWRSTPLRAAAALALLLVGQAVYRALRPDADPTLVTAARAFETPVGRADTLQLADGTTVVLAPASRLGVAAGYGRDARSVTLEGVAWFDVGHDGPPFTVLAGDALVTDLGTAFTVRADPEQPVRVTVTQGRVRLAVNTGTDSGVILDAGQSGTLDRGVARVDREDAGAAVAWTGGRLVFSDAPFALVAAELRRWHGVQLVAGDSALAARHLTSELQGEPLAAVISVIALALDARAEMRGDTIILRSRR